MRVPMYTPRGGVPAITVSRHALPGIREAELHFRSFRPTPKRTLRRTAKGTKHSLTYPELELS